MASERILLVDDDESMLRVVEKILKKAGREVICARDGREAIEKAQIHSFDLFICDVRMPGMDGIEAISQIKKSHPNSRCIVITGYADEAASIRAIRLGVDDYLKKPFKMEEFLRSVERSIELARDARAREERLQSMRENYLSVIQKMAEAFEDRDTFRAGHSKRVAGYARMLGEALGFSAERLDLLELAAGLEDVGLLGVKEEILNKVSPLGAAERKHIESHTSASHTILAPLTDLERVLPMILYHHEHFDGTGYPEGLAGDQIPLEARILAVSDAYCALTEDRPHRKRRQPSEALEILRKGTGKEFDPELVGLFQEAISAPDKPGFLKTDSPTATSYRVLLGLGKAYGNLEGVEVAEYAFQHILEREEEIRDPEVVIRAIGALGEIQAKRGELEAALDLFEQAIQKADSARNALLSSEMGVNKAQVFLRLGRQSEAFSLLDRAEEVFKIWKDHHQLARSLLARASAVPDVGPDSHFSRCLDLVKKHGNSDFFTQEMGLALPLLVEAFMAGLHEDFVPSLLRRAGPEAVPILVKKMPQKGNQTVKTIRLLGEMGGKEAEAALRTMVGNPAQEIRDAVRAALEKIQERGLVEKLKIVMFGPFRVQRGEVLIPQEAWTMKKAKSLLAYLVIHRDRQVPEDKVCDMFWPSLDAEKARNNLHTTVYKLRRTLEPHLAGGMASQYILYQRGFYRFNPDGNYWLDLEAFEEHCAEAEKAKAQGDSESAIRHFRQAASLYGGEFIEGLEEEWCIYQRVTLQQKYFDILVQISEQMAQTSLYQEAVEAARKILDVDRSYEKAHCLIMRSFASQGKRDEAIRQYHQCTDILKKELGLSPSPETEALYLKIIDRAL